MALGYAVSRRYELAAGMASGAAITAAIPKTNSSLRGSHQDDKAEPPLSEPSREGESSAKSSVQDLTRIATAELSQGKSIEDVATVIVLII